MNVFRLCTVDVDTPPPTKYTNYTSKEITPPPNKYINYTRKEITPQQIYKLNQQRNIWKRKPIDELVLN